MKKLKMLYKRVGREPEVLKIVDTAKNKEDLIGGHFDYISYMNKTLVCNEDRHYYDLKPNVIFDYGYVSGNFFIVNSDVKNGVFKSLTNREIKKLKEDLSKYSVHYSDNELKQIDKQEKDTLEQFYKDYERDIVFNESLYHYETEEEYKKNSNNKIFENERGD